MVFRRIGRAIGVEVANWSSQAKGVTMTDRRRRTFDSRDGDAEVAEPLLRAVLSYAPRDETPMPHPSEGITLRAENGSGSIRLELAIADELGVGVPGPFGSRFYECGSFEVVVPQRDPREGALLMIHTCSKPRRRTDSSSPHPCLRVGSCGSSETAPYRCSTTRATR